MDYKPSKTERVKAALGEAVIVLLREAPDRRMTVEDIVEQAGMSRATWFRNCAGKEDAVASALVDRWSRWAADKGVEAGVFLHPLPFLRYVYGERDVILLLYASGMRSAVLEASSRISDKLRRPDDGLEYRRKFFLYGVVGLIDEWVRKDFSDSPEDVAAAIDWQSIAKS